ncbi:MAG: transporter substrate-binding domain-containing protein, partial [Myxococcota bacterium]
PVPQTLRVGTSGDYAPFSISSGEESGLPEGFSVAIARAYAEERGLALEFVPFRWANLIPALNAERFDVAISGVTVRPERSAAGRFTVPVVETGAVLLVRQPERWSKVEDLDRGDVRIGVNAGGHLERVARERFPRAVLISIRNNLAVRTALVEETLHAAVTDTLEAPIWLRDTQGLAVLGPFTRDRKAILVRRDRPALAADLNDWLMERESDGSLAALRRRYLGESAGRPVATALGSLLAAIDERLALMPWVGVAKRRSGLPLEVPEREELVLDAVVAEVRAAADRAGVAPPPDVSVHRLFRAQMEAAKEVQWKAVKDRTYAVPEPLPDLNTSLRPGLIRIGERIAQLLLKLPRDLEATRVREAALEELRAPYLSERSALAIADAIAVLSRASGETDGPTSEGRPNE